MTKEVRGLINKSKHAIKVAQDLLAQGYPSDSASKSYYAIFYAAQALLKSAKIDVVKHSAVKLHEPRRFGKFCSPNLCTTFM